MGTPGVTSHTRNVALCTAIDISQFQWNPEAPCPLLFLTLLRLEQAHLKYFLLCTQIPHPRQCYYVGWYICFLWFSLIDGLIWFSPYAQKLKRNGYKFPSANNNLSFMGWLSLCSLDPKWHKQSLNFKSGALFSPTECLFQGHCSDKDVTPADQPGSESQLWNVWGSWTSKINFSAACFFICTG